MKISLFIFYLTFFIFSVLGNDMNKVAFTEEILPLLERYCYQCHGDGEEKGGLALDQYQTERDVQKGYRLWEQLHKFVVAGEMPPEHIKKRPSKSEQDLLAGWTRHALDKFYKSSPPDPGRVTVRRLNRTEYNNVVRDLMYVDFDPANDFPADDSGHGFDNIGDVLTVSPLLLEKYINAAEKIATKVIVKPESETGQGFDSLSNFQKEYFKYPIDRHLRRRAAEAFLKTFLRRAYRREVTSSEINRLLVLVKRGSDNGGSFEDGLRLAVTAVLVSPNFLFRWELDGAPDNPKSIRQLNEYELASRLAFFLWRSMPDDRLLDFAKKGLLRKNIESEIRRMIRDDRSYGMVRDFTGQWLGLRNLDVYKPDKKIFPLFTADLKEDMRRETELLYAHVLKNNLNVKELISADYSFINDRLAAHYQIGDIDGAHFRLVSLNNVQRRGLLGHGSILTVTSDPNRTSPVKRGKFVLDNILGTPPLPPPPNVPELEVEQGEGETLREQMIKHRSNVVCASCHKKMDPIGFAFENYDGIGRYRLTDNGEKIDTSGVLDTGESFKGINDLQNIITSKKLDLYVESLVRKMMVYALGRGLEFYDERVVGHIVKRLSSKGYQHDELVVSIVQSLPFDMKRGEASN